MAWEWHQYTDAPECWHADYLAALHAAGYRLPAETGIGEGRRQSAVLTTVQYTLLNVDAPGGVAPEDYSWIARP